MSFFDKIASWFKRTPNRVRIYVAYSLQITTNIRRMINSPIVDVLVDIIPTDWDKVAVHVMRDTIERVLPYLTIVDTCKDKKDVNQMMMCWLAELRKQPEPVQQALLHKFASLLTAMQDNRVMRTRDYDLFCQAYFCETL